MKSLWMPAAATLLDGDEPLRAGAAGSARAATVPRQRSGPAGGSGQRPPAPSTAPPPPTSAPLPEVPPPPPSAQAPEGLPVYPTAEFIDGFDAGSGQRYYLYGTDMPFEDIVAYYRNVLKNGGRELFREPPMRQFDLGRYQENTMAYPPSVVVKDYTWNGAHRISGRVGHDREALSNDHPDRPSHRRAVDARRRPDTFRRKQSLVWSLTRPTACMKA